MLIQVVGDDIEANPAFDAGQAFVAAAVQSVAAFQKTDAPFTAGAPLPGVAEPALLLKSAMTDFAYFPMFSFMSPTALGEKNGINIWR